MASTVTKERKEYRIWDDVNKVWNLLFFRTNAKSVDAADGKTLETKIGKINGITSDINGESDSIAASIKCVNALKKSVSDGKSTVASAITAKGVSTAADATFATMATNIRNIKTTGKVRIYTDIITGVAGTKNMKIYYKIEDNEPVLIHSIGFPENHPYAVIGFDTTINS